MPAIYLFRMMRRLGLEPGGGVVPRFSLRYATAVSRCSLCSSKQACLDWLESAPVSVKLAPLFCPNEDLLFELRFDQPWISAERSQSRANS